MIYTRSKDSFKAKTIKSANNTRHSTISQNGFNLVEELKQRIENKNKVKNQPLNQGIDSNTQNRAKSSKSSKKIRISKDFQENTQKMEQNLIGVDDKYKQIQVKSQNDFISEKNLFSKIKKQPFMQLVDSQYHNFNSLNEKKQKQIYESPIQNLQLSGYSSNGRKIQEYKYQNQKETNKQIYENKVKKWKNREVSNHQQIDLKINYNRKTDQFSNSNHNFKYQGFNLISGIIQLQVSCQPTLFAPSSFLTGQKEYVSLLQNDLSQIKSQLLSSIEKIKKLEEDSEKKFKQNNNLEGLQQELVRNIEQKQRMINKNSQQFYIIKKYERLLSKMRNLHILNAMEMIETKNFLELRFSAMNSNEGKTARQQGYIENREEKVKNGIQNDFKDCELRMNCINECIAKVEEIIEVSQKVVSLSHDEQTHLKSNVYCSQITIKQLQQSLMYKEKIIKKLKEDINKIKMNQQHSQTKSKSAKQSTFIKPYSYVDEIHLLRHQITRLTQQNCQFYQKYIQFKNFLQDKHNSVQKFPNQSRIQQIESLINKLDKQSQDQQIPNSKVQYWVNRKTHQQTNTMELQERKNEKDSHNIKTLNMIMLQNPNLQKNEELKSQKKSTDRIIRHSVEKQLVISKEEKVEYSKEEFSQLVKEFKSTLSGLTPQHSNSNSTQQNFKQEFKNNFSQNNSNQEKQLLTFRTSDQQPSTSIQNQPSEIHCQFTAQNYLEKISRLQYQKEFLTSERENLLKQNDHLTQKITQLQNQINTSPNLTLLQEQIYKLNFQNQELVDRIVQTQNLLIKNQQSPMILNQQNKISKQLKYRESENEKLKETNQKLNLRISQLQEQKMKLAKSLQSTKSVSHDNQGIPTLPYTQTSSFQPLIDFFKQQPQKTAKYHKILLKMIESYEKKVSQLREENVMMKTQQTHFEQILMNTESVLQRVLKLFKSDKLVKQFKNPTLHNQPKTPTELNLLDFDQGKKLILQVNKVLSQISDMKRKQSFVESKQLSPMNEKNLVKSYLMRINYHLMFIRSLIQGIGESDLEVIEGELSDYLKQLRKRIPTVLETQEYDESNLPSLNSSITHE